MSESNVSINCYGKQKPEVADFHKSQGCMLLKVASVLYPSDKQG